MEITIVKGISHGYCNLGILLEYPGLCLIIPSIVVRLWNHHHLSKVKLFASPGACLRVPEAHQGVPPEDAPVPGARDCQVLRAAPVRSDGTRIGGRLLSFKPLLRSSVPLQHLTLMSISLSTSFHLINSLLSLLLLAGSY